MDGKQQNWQTAPAPSAHRLPDWAFGILLWLLLVGAPFSLVTGLWVGMMRTMGIGDTGGGFFDFVVVLGYGIAGAIIGTGVLALAAFGGYGFFALFRRCVRLLISAILLSWRKRPSVDPRKQRGRI
jgi:hypothetical protein